MKRILYYLMALLVLSSCGKDYDAEIEDLLRKIEEVGNKITDTNKEISDIYGEWSKPDPVIPELQTFEFLADANSTLLVENISCEIIGDSVVECWIPNVMPNKNLTPSFTFKGDEVKINGTKIESDKSTLDFSKPLQLEVTSASANQTKTYQVYVHAFTGLPVIWIDTENRKEITSKTTYRTATFKMVEDVKTRGPGDVTEATIQIRGRGNSTWREFPKKPYQIKFEEKISLLGMPANKTWVLIADYDDKTILRSSTALYMSKISNLAWTPRSHYVDVMLNGRYNGTYQLTEKVKEGKNRVNVGDDGFLLEFDTHYDTDDAVFFPPRLKTFGITTGASLVKVSINIKHPDVVTGDADYNYIKNYVLEAENVLYSADFKDPEKGWQKYFDLDSWAEWYIINEIIKNRDANLLSSCYMYKTREGKLFMGPVWDFDRSLGNCDYDIAYDYRDLWINTGSWFARLYEDPTFVAKVKERFQYFYSRKEDIKREIDANAMYIRRSIMENEAKWQILYVYIRPNYDIWGAYMNEVESMKQWLDKRFDWLKNKFESM